MRAAMFHGPRDVRVMDVPDPVAGPGEVVVRVERAGICGSDVNRFRYGSHPWPPPFIMGHEFCGTIADCGPGVRDWKVGTAVVVQPTLSCETCFYCLDGHPNRCMEFARRGLTGSGTDGGFAEYVRVPAYQPHARPPALPVDIASLVEPTAVSVHGFRLAGLDRPEAVVVVGLGNIGLLAVLAARSLGAGDVIAIGKYSQRQALARAYGAGLVLEPDDPDLVGKVRERTGGLGAPLVIEAAGAGDSLRTAVGVARKGGKIVVLGVFHQEVALDYRAILMDEKQIIGSIIYQRPDFVEAIAILAAGGIDRARHITGEIGLADIVAHGFAPLVERRAEHIKIQVTPGPAS
jgi:(R,R)-butanediol dehydrogenase/meso-butanediol dehydrogenase/diacetyl reductase